MGKPRAAALGTQNPATVPALKGRHISIHFADSSSSIVIIERNILLEKLMAQSLASLNYHLVFSTKHRLRLISEEIEQPLHRYVAGILRNHRGTLLRAGGMPDHRHFLVSLHRELAVAEAIRLIKSNSTPWIREKLGNRRFNWQGGYAAFSVSFSRCAAVARYIDNQKIHHRKRNFQEELRWLLETNGVAYDERYLFA